MKIVVNEILNDWIITKGKDKVVEQHIVEGENFKDIFPKIYAFERSSRYDNSRRYDITDKDIKAAYEDWKQYGVTIEMYYGGGVVD